MIRAERRPTEYAREPVATRGRAALVIALAAALAAALVLPPAAGAFELQRNAVQTLDGRTVMSPSAERVTTLQPDGGAAVAPGRVAQRSIILQNRTRAPVTFDLDVAEVVGSRSEDVVEVRHGSRGGAAAWATLERRSVTLRPGDQATIGLRIAIPRRVAPGSKPFGVSATQRQSTTSTSSGVTAVFRQIAIFIVDLPGDAPVRGGISKLDLLEGSSGEDAGGEVGKVHLGGGDPQVRLEYANQGERLLTPSGTIEVRNLFGRVVSRQPVERFTAYPDGGAVATAELDDLPALGILRARVELTSDAGQQERDLPRFAVMPTWFPWVAGIGLPLLIAGLVVFVIRWRRARALEWEGLEDYEDDDELP